MSALLKINKLKTYYIGNDINVMAVDGVNLEVGKKEAVGLVGESGCGKTTLAWSIIRLVPEPGKIIDGTIYFKDKNLLKLTEGDIRKIRGKYISMIFQSPMTYLNPVISIKNQISEKMMLHLGISKEEAIDKVINILGETQIPSPEIVADYYPHQLSGGMQQRALIAMAISCSPELLIADEPTTALDTTVQTGILDLFKELKKKEDFSTLVITHDLGVVAELCDKLYIMYAGKIVEYGDIFEIFENPANPYTKGLLDSTLSIDEYKKDLVSIPGVVPDMRNPPKGCRFHPRCKFADVKCREKEPEEVALKDNHSVFCWLIKN
ncbi:ABC transporter ATP-binding protein [Thermoproteota archaeon]